MANQSNKMKPMDAILMSVGAIIGAGVFSMTGVAVGLLGQGSYFILNCRFGSYDGQSTLHGCFVSSSGQRCSISTCCSVC